MTSSVKFALLVAAAAIGTNSSIAFAEAGVPEYTAAVRSDIAFPNPAKAVRKNGAFVPAENIRLVTPGLTKKQVYTLLDVPHFHEGLFGERKWDYVLNFYTGRGTEYVSCQFQIIYDKKRRVEAAYWHSDACLPYMKSAQPAITPAAAVVQQPVAEVGLAGKIFTVNFPFDSAELLPESLSILEDVVRQIGPGTRQVTIAGYTDTSGGEVYNQGLSLRRAKVVAAALEKLGVDSSRYSIVAHGEHHLAISTDDGVKEMRNRRSQIIIAF